MSREKETLTYVIADNGVGIKEKDIESPESLGLIGIKERVHPWDGQVNFESSPGKGTMLIITLLLKKP